MNNDTFDRFYNEFKDWSKEDILKRTYNIILDDADKTRQIEQLENIRKEAIGYVTSYESISTIQGLDDIEKNKNLDEKTMNEMINRYLKVHDILLNILNKGSDKE